MSALDKVAIVCITDHFASPESITELSIQQVQGVETLFAHDLTYFESAAEKFFCFSLEGPVDDTEGEIRQILQSVVTFRDKTVTGQACKTTGRCPDNCTGKYELPHEFHTYSFAEFDDNSYEWNHYFLWHIGSVTK